MNVGAEKCTAGTKEAAEKLTTEGGGGFNPRIEPAESPRALEPIRKLVAPTSRSAVTWASRPTWCADACSTAFLGAGAPDSQFTDKLLAPEFFKSATLHRSARFSAGAKAHAVVAANSARDPDPKGTPVPPSCPVTEPCIFRICKTAVLLKASLPQTVRILAVLLAAGWQHGMAQTAPPASTVGPYRIAGTVVNAVTGDPVRRATVAVLEVAESHAVESVETDTDGRFALEHLVAAKYQLTASKRGFITAFYDEHEEFSTAIVTGEGHNTEALTFRMMPAAAIHGVIAGDGGDSVEGAKVLLFQRPRSPAAPGRGERITQTDSTATDDTGAFEFDGLAAGEYLLAVTAEPWFAIHSPAMDGRKLPAVNQNAELDVAYPVTFFDSTTEEASAAPIVLANGKREEANISLRAVPALRLVVETPGKRDSSNPPRADLRQTIFGIETTTESAFSDGAKEGTVEFAGVAPGRYRLVQGDPSRVSDLVVSASQQVDAKIGVPAFSVSGMMRMASGSALPDGIGVSLVPAESKGPLAPLEANSLDGGFSFPAVPPGAWEIWVESGGVQLPVLSTTEGAKSRQGNRIEVKDRALSMMVTLSQDGTRVEGFARKDGKGVGGAMVVLVPKDPGALRAMARRDQSDSDGSFSLRDVAPGQYTVVAIEDGWDLDWAHHGALDRFLAYGIAVTVTGQSETGQSGKHIRLSAPVPVQAR